MAIVLALSIALTLLLAAGSASALLARFDGIDPSVPGDIQFGFDPTAPFTTSVDYVIDASTPFLSAAPPGSAPVLDVIYSGSASGSQCLLLGGAGDCLDTIPVGEGPYSGIVTLRIESISANVGTGPFILMLTTVASEPDYPLDLFGIELDPLPPTSTSSVTPPFTPFVRIRDDAIPGQPFYYLGWVVNGVGSEITFRYEVETAQLPGGTPVFLTNALPASVVVPEPGSALLMGLGLGWLAFRARR